MPEERIPIGSRVHVTWSMGFAKGNGTVVGYFEPKVVDGWSEEHCQKHPFSYQIKMDEDSDWGKRQTSLFCYDPNDAAKDGTINII